MLNVQLNLAKIQYLLEIGHEIFIFSFNMLGILDININRQGMLKSASQQVIKITPNLLTQSILPQKPVYCKFSGVYAARSM